MTSVEELEFASKYTLDLLALRSNSKPHINTLSMIAEKNPKFAPIIVETIEKHVYAVKTELKLPVLYLIDSILKNVKGDYIGLFEKNIDLTFLHVFKKVRVEESVKLKMWKVRSTWSDIFSSEKLNMIDAKCHELDPEWPVIRNSTANSSVLPSSSSSTSSTSSAYGNPNRNVSETRVIGSPIIGTTPTKCLPDSPNVPSKRETAKTTTTAAAVVQQEILSKKRSMSPLVIDYMHQEMQTNLETGPDSRKRVRRESFITLDDTSNSSHHETTNQINYQSSNDSQHVVVRENLLYSTFATSNVTTTPPTPTFVNNMENLSPESTIIMQQVYDHQPPPPPPLPDCSDISSNPIHQQTLNRNTMIIVQDDGNLCMVNDCETDICDEFSPESSIFDSSQFQNQIQDQGDNQILAQEERIKDLEAKLQQAVNEKVQEQHLFDTIQRSYEALERELQNKFKDKLRQFNKDVSQQLIINRNFRMELEKKEAVNLELNGIIKGLSDRNMELEDAFSKQMQLLHSCGVSNLTNDKRIIEAVTLNEIAEKMRTFMPVLPIYKPPTVYDKIFETDSEPHLALEIFEKLEFHDLLSCSQVCTKWSELVTPLLVTKTPTTNPDDLEQKTFIENILKVNSHQIDIHYTASRTWQVIQVVSPLESGVDENLDPVNEAKPLQILIPAFNALPFIFREVVFVFHSGEIESNDAQKFFTDVGKRLKKLKLNLIPIEERSSNAIKKDTLQNLLTIQAPNLDSLELILTSGGKSIISRVFNKKVNLTSLKTLKLNLSEKFDYGTGEILKELLNAAINLKTFETNCINNNNNDDGKLFHPTFSLDYIRVFLKTDQLHTIKNIDYLVPSTDLIEHYELFAHFSRNMANAPHSWTQIKCLGIDLRGIPNIHKVWTKLMGCINTILNSHYKSLIGLVCHGLVQNWYRPGFNLDFPVLPILERLKIVVGKDFRIFPDGFNVNHLFPALRVLYLDFGSFSSVKWKNIFPDVQALPVVKKVVLRLSGNHSTAATTEYLRELAKLCPNTDDLTICYLYHFTAAGMVLWKAFPFVKFLHLNLVISNEKNPCESVDAFFTGYLREACTALRRNPAVEYIGNRRIAREFPSIINMTNLEDLTVSFHGNFRKDRQSFFPNLLSHVSGNSFNEMEKDLKVTFFISSLKNVKFADRASVKNGLIPFGTVIDEADETSSHSLDETSFSYFMSL